MTLCNVRGPDINHRQQFCICIQGICKDGNHSGGPYGTTWNGSYSDGKNKDISRSKIRLRRTTEMSQCNYCHYKQLEREAKDKGLVLTKRLAHGGTDVFMHPKGTIIDNLAEEGLEGTYFVAWFMELTDKCAC